MTTALVLAVRVSPMLDSSPLKAVIPTHLGGARPSLDPYSHLLRVVVPGVAGIAVYDARGTPLWVCSEYLGPDPQPLVEVALQDVPPLTTAEIDGFMRDHQGSPAYVFRIRDDHGVVVAVCCLIMREATDRPYSLIQGLVRPVLECLRRELDARASVGVLARNLEAHDHDLALLLDMPGEACAGDELGVLTQKCADHLGCELAALVVPERAIALCRAAAGVKPRLNLLTHTHRQLLSWAQLQRRALVINRFAPPSGPEALPPFRILSLPVQHPSGRLMGFLALFRAEQAPEFTLKDEQLVGLIARRMAATLIANFDPLTGLLTRAALAGQVQAVLMTDTRAAPHAVLYLDVDALHAVNETLGMQAGDEVLGKIAEVLRRRPRSNALSGRLSGDRFAVFLPGCSAAEAVAVAELIQEQCAGISCPGGDEPVPVSLSIGVAEVPEGPSAFDHALAQAEVACKSARLQARGSVQVHQRSAQAALADPAEAALLGQLQAALDRHGFTLFAQPMQPLQPLAGAPPQPCFELLLRLKDTGRETVGPAKFLAVAARHGLMTRIDQWVVNEVLRTLRSHATALAGGTVRFAINLSASAVGDESFHAFLEARIRDSGVPPAMLCFEIAESTAAASLSRVDRLLQRLRLQGCSFALDDFGTGLSSLAHLRTLPVSLLKIDGALVREASTSQRTEAMVRAIAQLAHAMGMETVAECVESDESRTRMATLGIDYGQGFAIGRPVPLDEVLADLALYGAVAGWS